MSTRACAALAALLVPATHPVVFHALPWRPRVHLAIFVHRVRDLTPGLYLLVREPHAEPLLRAALTGDFLWETPEGGPARLGLYLLERGDFHDAARMVACHQDIAGDGCFTVGGPVDDPRLRTEPPYAHLE